MVDQGDVVGYPYVVVWKLQLELIIAVALLSAVFVGLLVCFNPRHQIVEIFLRSLWMWLCLLSVVVFCVSYNEMQLCFLLLSVDFRLLNA